MTWPRDEIMGSLALLIFLLQNHEMGIEMEVYSHRNQLGRLDGGRAKVL